MRTDNGPPKQRAGTNQRGFTFIEIMVVLLIIAMAVLITLPNLQRARIKTGTSSALATVSGVYLIARAEAVKRHSDVTVTYDETARDISAVDDNNETIIFRRFPTRLQPASGFTTDLTDIVYGVDGMMKTGPSILPPGTAYLEDKVGNTFRIRINQFTGVVRVEQRLDNGSWTAQKEAWKWKY